MVTLVIVALVMVALAMVALVMVALVMVALVIIRHIISYWLILPCRYDEEFETCYLERMRNKLGLIKKQLPDDRYKIIYYST